MSVRTLLWMLIDDKLDTAERTAVVVSIEALLREHDRENGHSEDRGD